MEQLSQRYDCDLLAKVVFSFSPDIVLSPLALPRSILNRVIDTLLSQTHTTVMQDLLRQLQQRPTFQEQWPDDYAEAIARGKQRVLKLEQIRSDKLTLANILAQDPEIYDWWNAIA
jgi:hypothetical protein